MSEEITPLTLPSTLPFPIRVTRIDVGKGSTVERGTRLFSYAFTSHSIKGETDGQDGRVAGSKSEKTFDLGGTWECPLDGILDRWSPLVVVGKIIERSEARNPIVYIQQPCSHPIQFGGLCGVCGKDLGDMDYMSGPAEASSQAGPSRFPGSFEMGHDSMGVTVSRSEAERLDDQTRTALLSSRKLSLIVDLDQTIIHTTVDPTVGEWIEEIRVANANGTEHVYPADNPNEDALKDVASFELEDEVPAGWKSRAKAPDRTYYTKPRPGLPHFLEQMSRLYEMHVYTMGTRNYADAIVKAVDPEGKYFGGRILSRDESGTRLFPTDQSMVVIIDDRSDVWADSPNLIKVVPYEFFLGAGDINSSFLPPVKKAPSSEPSSPESLSATSDLSTPLADPGGGESEDDSLTRKVKLLDKLSEERPLQKMQDELDKQQDEDAAAGEGSAAAEVQASANDGAESEQPVNGGGRSTTPEASPLKRKRPLLRSDDEELNRVASILRTVHRTFYQHYDVYQKGNREIMPDECDAPFILAEMKSHILEGCTIAFSGVIPQGVRPERSYEWQTAELFGAIPTRTITSKTTHCVTATLGTEKTYQAQKAGIHLVWYEWFTKCVALWKRVDEADFACRPSRVGTPGKDQSKTSAPTSTTGLGLDDDVQVESGTTPAAHEPNSSTLVNDNVEPTNGSTAEAQDVYAFGETEEDLEALAGNDQDDDEWLKETLGDDWDDDQSEIGSERGSRRVSASPSPAPSSAPDTPRKRVRYADQEGEPLASFRQNSLDDGTHDQMDELDSPPRKRKAILLGPPPTGDGVSVNKIELSESAKARIARQVEESIESGVDDEQDKEDGESEATEGEDDEFAQMLAASMAD